MSYFGKFYLRILFFSMVLRIKSASTDKDLFYKSTTPKPEDEAVGCGSDMIKLICFEKCGPRFTCAFGKCYCEEPVTRKDLFSVFGAIKEYILTQRQKNTKKKENQKYEEFSDLTQVRLDEDSPPALRHHIAHFCPNLDVARTCIRTCMKKGKPAFCAKDHNCYCGHKYKETDNDKPLDVNDMYAEFRDLYEKYFGPNLAYYRDDY